MIVEPKKPLVLVDFEEYMNLLNIKEMYSNLITIEDSKKSQTIIIPHSLTTIEQELNDVPKPIVAATHIHDGLSYIVMTNSKIKVRGIFEKFLAHPIFGPAFKTALDQVPEDVKEGIMKAWLDVVVYKALYDCPDGQIWVRMAHDFKENFKPVSK